MLRQSPFSANLRDLVATGLLIPVWFSSTWLARGADHPGEDASLASVPTRYCDDVFGAGRFETMLGAGALFSPHRNEDLRQMDYTLFTGSFGVMLNTPQGEAWWRGNAELGVETFGGNFLTGDGSYLIGTQAWLRYNFVPIQGRWTPFARAGCGGLLTDATTEVVGQRFNFVTSLGIGLRYHFDSQRAVSLEYRFQHISNGGLSSPNLGINAQGVMLCLSQFF